MGPDAKVQVTVQYSKENQQITPMRIDTILISCQHNENTTQEQIQKDLKTMVIEKAIP